MIKKIEQYGEQIIWMTIAFFVCVYASLIFNENIWTDEAFTLQLLTENYGGITLGTINDVHPPLYYYLAKLPTYLFGKNLQILKIVSIVPMGLTYALFATKVKKRFGKLSAFMGIIFLGCIPCTMEFTVQLRMYTLALLCVTGAGIYAYEAYVDHKRKDWAWLVLYSVSAAYTHYFAFVSIIAINGVLFCVILLKNRKLIKSWLISIVIMVVLYVPWIPSFIHQVTGVTNSYWIPEITSETIWAYFKWMFGFNTFPYVVYIMLGILAVLLIVMVIRSVAFKDAHATTGIIAFSIPVITMVTGIVLSLLLRPIYRDQYIMPSLALLAIFVGIACSKIYKVLVGIFIIALFSVGIIQYTECYHQEYNSTYTKKTKDYLAQVVGENDWVLYNWNLFGFIYREYFPEYQLSSLDEFDFGSDFDVAWLISTKYELMPSQELLDQYGLVMEKVGAYGIEHNEFDLYWICKLE